MSSFFLIFDPQENLFINCIYKRVDCSDGQSSQTKGIKSTLFLTYVRNKIDVVCLTLSSELAHTMTYFFHNNEDEKSTVRN